jgi:LytS/YehU family sensor histidine kinase
VENAIKHGIGPRAAAGHIAIAAHRRNGMLALEVSDDGVGERPDTIRREGVGLGNSRARLQSLYGDACRFEAGSGDRGGFHVYIEIPFLTRPRTPRAEGSPP